MTPQELRHIICSIKVLPDHMLIRLLQACTTELLKRTKRGLEALHEDFTRN